MAATFDFLRGFLVRNESYILTLGIPKGAHPLAVGDIVLIVPSVPYAGILKGFTLKPPEAPYFRTFALTVPPVPRQSRTTKSVPALLIRS